MNRLLAAILAVTMAYAANSFAQCDDPFDHTLCVPYISGTDSASINLTDHAASAYWSNWSGKDYMSMIPPDQCFPGRCNFVGGATDAQITIKAAANSIGFYMY